MISTLAISPTEEKALIQMAADGNLEAFNQLVFSYQDLVYTQARFLLDDPMLAEDATQDCFIKAFRSIRRFMGGSFRAWLIRIVINTALDMLRWGKRNPREPLFPQNEYDEELEPGWLADPTPSVEMLVEQHELSNHLYGLIRELPEYYRVVLTLIDMFEMDYAEVAEALSLPLGTVKSRLARARRQMRRKLLGGEMCEKAVNLRGEVVFSFC